MHGAKYMCPVNTLTHLRHHLFSMPGNQDHFRIFMRTHSEGCWVRFLASSGLERQPTHALTSMTLTLAYEGLFSAPQSLLLSVHICCLCTHVRVSSQFHVLGQSVHA